VVDCDDGDDDDDDDKTIPDVVPEDTVQFKEDKKQYHIMDMVPVYSKPNKQGVHELIPIEDLLDEVQRNNAAWNVTTIQVDSSKRRKVDSWITDWGNAHKNYASDTPLRTDIEPPRLYGHLVYHDTNGLHITKKLLKTKLPNQELTALVPFPTAKKKMVFL
jgi:hypothetical protein